MFILFAESDTGWYVLIGSIISALLGFVVALFRYRLAERREWHKEYRNTISRLDSRVTILEGENSECRQQNAQLQAELAALREAMRYGGDPCGDAIIVVNSQGVITDWSAGATALLHWRREMVVGQPVTILMHEQQKDSHEKIFARAVQEGRISRKNRSVRTVARRGDGSELPITVTLNSWKDQDGQLFFSGQVTRLI